MLGDKVDGASGMAATAARPLTMEALTSVTAEPARKFRRDNIVLAFLLMAGGTAGIGGDHGRQPMWC